MSIDKLLRELEDIEAMALYGIVLERIATMRRLYRPEDLKRICHKIMAELDLLESEVLKKRSKPE